MRDTVNYGSKRTVSGAHYGVRDWLAQRLSGALMAVFTLVVLAQALFASGPMNYVRWAGIFAPQWMKALTFAVIVALIWHAWIGMRDIWMDYVRRTSARLTLEFLTIVWLAGCGGWAVQALWRL
jgi:succinate dehydrogenase / fumarate reductase membrane anchor subunit